MKNPIIITLDNNEHVEIGDPFIYVLMVNIIYIVRHVMK